MKHINPEIDKPGVWNYLKHLGLPRGYEAGSIRDFLENRGQIPDTKTWFPLSLVARRDAVIHFPEAKYQLEESNAYHGQLSDETGVLDVAVDLVLNPPVGYFEALKTGELRDNTFLVQFDGMKPLPEAEKPKQVKDPGFHIYGFY